MKENLRKKKCKRKRAGNLAANFSMIFRFRIEYPLRSPIMETDRDHSIQDEVRSLSVSLPENLFDEK